MQKPKSIKIHLDTDKLRKVAIIAGVSLGIITALAIVTNEFYRNNYLEFKSPIVIQSPVEVKAREVKVEYVTVTPTPEPELAEKLQSWTGIASYYTFDLCLGCNPQRIMANGEILDDTKLTVAFNQAPLGSRVRIKNIRNSMYVDAIVSDTGGFEKLGRIVDVSLKVKNSINLNGLEEVKVTLLED